MSNVKRSFFETVTELPGNRAHREQIDALCTRYKWAANYCRDKDVLEIACGAGLGIGLLEENANSVIGGDLDATILKYAQEHYRGRNRVKIMKLDACEMDIKDNSIDLVICFEAIYYFPSMLKFLEEVKRVLRPNGTYLCGSVNCEWHGFNPSPYSKKYYSVADMRKVLESVGFKVDFFFGFEDNPKKIFGLLISYIRVLAVKTHLVPKTMRAKELLKRLFYGKLKPLPPEIRSEHGRQRPLIELDKSVNSKNYKFIYHVASPF